MFRRSPCVSINYTFSQLLFSVKRVAVRCRSILYTTVDLGLDLIGDKSQNSRRGGGGVDTIVSRRISYSVSHYVWNGTSQ